MQSAKKSTKALSALSIAAIAALGAKSASAATLNSYYNGVSVFQSDNLTPDANPSIASPTLNASTPTTITLTVGEFLDFGIDAVVTNNINPDAGKNTGTTGKTTTRQIQPSNLGLAQLGFRIPSSDTNASLLLPLQTASRTAVDGKPAFDSSAWINNTPGASNVASKEGVGAGGGSQGGAVATGQARNDLSGAIPFWSSAIDVGDTVPTHPGNGGQVGIGFQIVAGSTSTTSNVATGVEQLSAFGAASVGAALGGTGNNSKTLATDFFDTLEYQGTAAGTVTLSPFADPTATNYWSLTGPGSSSTVSGYGIAPFTAVGDTIIAMPVLVVKIVPNVSVPTGHSLLSLTSSATTPTGYGVQITNGTGANQGTFTGPGAAVNKLTVVGSSGFYAKAEVTGIKDGASNANGPSTDYVEANGFSPATDEEVYALDVLFNGVAANQSQLNALVTAIQTFNGGPTGPAMTVTTVSPVPNPFGSQYNLFIDPHSAADNFLAFDFSNSNDSGLPAGYTVSAVAVVPEPMSLGLLALGGVGLMARRNRRKA